MDEDLKRLMDEGEERGIFPQPIVLEDGLDDDLLIERHVSKKVVKIDLRRMALTKLIPALPPTDTLLYIIAADMGAEGRNATKNMQFDFGTILSHFVELLGGVDCWVYGSTWTLNEAHADLMVKGLQEGSIGRMVLFMDGFFMSRTPDAAQKIIEGFKPFPRAKYLTFRNHTKLLCVANAEESQAVTVTSSANWLARPRHEQFTIDTDLGVYQAFKTQFFEAIAHG